MGVDSVRRLSEGSAGCGDLRGAVNPKIPDICHFPGKSGRCCIVRAVPGPCRAQPGPRRDTASPGRQCWSGSEFM